MRILIPAAACVAIMSVTSVPVAAKPPAKAGFQLNETSWTFTDKKGVKIQESIDADGKYIANSAAGKHIDHGTGVMKGDKACFTSAMDKKGEICWTTRPVAIGHTMMTKSDKGEKLTVKRVAYTPLSMPK